jgi:hypothetical protein
LEQDTLFQDEQGQVRVRWLWIGVLVLALLLFSCLALAAINSGPGWGPEGMKTHYQLENIFTNVPDCLVDMPCPPRTMVPNTAHWVLWITAVKQTPTGVETQRQILLDIPLPW